MIISAYTASFSLQISQSYSLIEAVSQEVAPEEPVPAVEPAPAAEIAPATESTPAEEKETPKLRGENGVLRLLQEGHFKGNAEMRLREIFHRELTILAEMNGQTPASEPAAEDADIAPEAAE